MTTPTGPTLDHAEYLGASDIGAIVGASPWGTALDVYMEKCGHAKHETEAMTIGKIFERPTVAAYLRLRCRADTAMEYPGTLLSPHDRHMGATVDAVQDGHINIEVKQVGQRVRGWGTEDMGREGVPEYVRAQTYWQAGILRQNGYLIDQIRVIAKLGTEMRVFQYEPDEETFTWLFEAGRKWWVDHILAEVPPEWTGKPGGFAAAVGDTLPNTGEMIEMTDELCALAVQLLEAKAAKRAAEYMEGRAKDAIEEALAAEQALGAANDEMEVVWRPKRGQVSYKDVCRTLGVDDATMEKHRGSGSRSLHVKRLKDEE